MTSSVSGSSSNPPLQFSGLASGLDTTSIISSLMAIASQPQTALKNAVANQQAQVSAYQSINSSIMALSTMAGSFATGSTWTQLAATSSNSAITVTASSSAVPSTTSLTVSSVAAGASAFVTTAPAAGVTFTVNDSSGNPLTYTAPDGTTQPVTFSSGSGSMSDMAAAINQTTTNSGLRAVVINSTDASGNVSPVLEITSSNTGTTSNFSIFGSDGSTLATATNGVDAKLTVDGQQVVSHTNTVAITDGVTVTLGAGAAAAGTNTSTIAVTDDGTSRSSAMSQFIDQINSVLTTISQATAYGTISTTDGGTAAGAGILAGDADLRSVATSLVNTVFDSDNTVSLGAMGIGITQDGQLTFDKDTFNTAYQANPNAVQSAFVGPTGFVSRVQQVALQSSASANTSYTDFATGHTSYVQSDGMLINSITSLNSQISNETDDINNWTDILAQRQASLEAQYTALETTLSTLQSQGSYVTQMLGGLSTTTSTSSSSSSSSL